MGFAYVLGKPIYLLNLIPKMPYYETELIALRPIVIDGALDRIHSLDNDSDDVL